MKVSESKWHLGSALKNGWCKREEARGDIPGAGYELQGRGVGGGAGGRKAPGVIRGESGDQSSFVRS